MCEVIDQNKKVIKSWPTSCFVCLYSKVQELVCKRALPPTTFVLCKTLPITKLCTKRLSQHTSSFAWCPSICTWWAAGCGDDWMFQCRQPANDDQWIRNGLSTSSLQWFTTQSAKWEHKCDNNLNIAALDSCTDVIQLMHLSIWRETRDRSRTPREVR